MAECSQRFRPRPTAHSQTSRSSTVVRITGMAFGRLGSTNCVGRRRQEAADEMVRWSRAADELRSMVSS
jgi:hypothetical protein